MVPVTEDSFKCFDGDTFNLQGIFSLKFFTQEEESFCKRRETMQHLGFGKEGKCSFWAGVYVYGSHLRAVDGNRRN